jgi:3-hydroxyisobutyrate dehydrogenase-like beta-hydroxyacid dehydrogenase
MKLDVRKRMPSVETIYHDRGPAPGAPLSMRIGVAGLGRMGAAVFERLSAREQAPLAWNRSPHPLATAPTPRALAEACDVIVSFVSGESANHHVHAGADGLFEAVNAPLLIACATLSPRCVRELSAQAHDRGARFVEAPVLGTVKPALQGELIALVGAAPEEVAVAQAALADLCRLTFNMGPVGAGAVMKIVHNVILSLYWCGVGEALGFGRANGVAVASMVDVIGESFAANRQWPLKASILREEDESVGFSIAGLAAELALIENEFETAGAFGPMLTLARARADAAVAAGWGERDVVSIALYRPKA